MQLSGQLLRIRTVPHIPGNKAFKKGTVHLYDIFTNPIYKHSAGMVNQTN
jgi:hypothetical protein